MTQKRKAHSWRDASSSPSTSENAAAGYVVGDTWIREDTNRIWALVDDAAGTWLELGTGGGGGGSSDHAALTNLPWTDSGHTGTATRVAVFDGSGNAAYSTYANVVSTGGGMVSGDAAGGDLGGTYPNPTVTRARGLRDSGGTTFSMGALANDEVLITSGGTVTSESLTALLSALGIAAPEVTLYEDGTDAWETHTIPDEHTLLTILWVQGGGAGGRGRNEPSGARNGGGGGGSGASGIWTGPVPPGRELEIFRASAADPSAGGADGKLWRVAIGAQSTSQEYELLRSAAANAGSGGNGTGGSPGAAGNGAGAYGGTGRYTAYGTLRATAGTNGTAGGTAGAAGASLTPPAGYHRTGGSGGGGCTSGGVATAGGTLNSSGDLPGAAGGTAPGGNGNVGIEVSDWLGQGGTGGAGSATGDGGTGGGAVAPGCGGGGGGGGTGVAGNGAIGGAGGWGQMIVITY